MGSKEPPNLESTLDWQSFRFDRARYLRDIILHSGQSSSVAEQGTHKPLVGGSNPSSGTTRYPRKTQWNQASRQFQALCSAMVRGRAITAQTGGNGNRWQPTLRELPARKVAFV
jgi:hypothetical protein